MENGLEELGEVSHKIKNTSITSSIRLTSAYVAKQKWNQQGQRGSYNWCIDCGVIHYSQVHTCKCPSTDDRPENVLYVHGRILCS